LDDLHTFEQVCRAMNDPGFYPHTVSKPERRETHISVVFLTGAVAYKLKKPLDFGFLDYTGLETRRRMCEIEVLLNQRLSRGIYEGVVPICAEEAGSIGSNGEVVEYAVKMRQLPDGASLANLLAAAGSAVRIWDGLGATLPTSMPAANGTQKSNGTAVQRP